MDNDVQDLFADKMDKKALTTAQVDFNNLTKNAFSTIVADPPWPYKGIGPVGTGGRGGDGTTHDGKRSIKQVGAALEYNLMSLNEIAGLPVPLVAANNAHLYLWTTNSFIKDAWNICSDWGFVPKTILTWVKVKADGHTPSMKTGYYYRSATEQVVFAVRGSLRLRGPCRPTIFYHPRLPHSVKPDPFFAMVEEQSPGPYLELFARRNREGWTIWGNESK